jgi:hypothetical protein
LFGDIGLTAVHPCSLNSQALAETRSLRIALDQRTDSFSGVHVF